MSGYRLADRSLSTDYRVGDEFEVVEYTGSYHIGDTVIADEIVRNIFYSGGCPIRWHWVKPTLETKRKAHYRKTGKWLVLERDYIVHSDMSFEQYMKWCDAAKECGFSLDYIKLNADAITFADEEGDLVSSWYTDVGAQRNTTEEFLDFLAKEEKDMKQFTKADLKDGMRCINRGGYVWYVCGYSMVKPADGVVKPFMEWCNDLTGRFCNSLDIMKVMDRDGTILFEREEEEPTELTIEEIAEKFGLPVECVRIKK